MNYLLHLLIYFDIFVIVALSLNLIVGYCGLLTMAHAGYYAIGAYSYALLSVKAGWGFFPSVAVAIVICGGLSLAITVSAWRLRGDFFVLASLAIQALIFSLLYNWSSPDAPLGSWSNLTNGPFGIPGIPRPHVFGWVPQDRISFTLFATAVACGCGWVLWRLQHSPWGRLLASVRDDELAARGLGKDTRLVKLQAITIASGIAGVAGALYASYVGYLDPSAASLEDGILFLSMVIVGGLGNFRGPVVGAAVLIALPEAIRFLDLPSAQAGPLRLLIYGLLLVVFMHVRPQGLAGTSRVK
jgi:branched-chain amino acid transport system permease protein